MTVKNAIRRTETAIGVAEIMYILRGITRRMPEAGRLTQVTLNSAIHNSTP
jgi:hypothetical protein